MVLSGQYSFIKKFKKKKKKCGQYSKTLWMMEYSICFCSLACNNFMLLLELEMDWFPIGESDFEVGESNSL